MAKTSHVYNELLKLLGQSSDWADIRLTYINLDGFGLEQSSIRSSIALSRLCLVLAIAT
jgi:hypothetical protein